VSTESVGVASVGLWVVLRQPCIARRARH